jgi:hypothetical protein
MSGYVWDLSGTDKQCASYAPGHLIHWIHFNHSMREPSAVIPVTAVVDDNGLVHIEGDDVSLVRWNHRPALLRCTGSVGWRLGSHAGTSWRSRRRPSSGVREPCSVWRRWTKGANATFTALLTLTTWFPACRLRRMRRPC